jgi:hypothetical protein
MWQVLGITDTKLRVERIHKTTEMLFCPIQQSTPTRDAESNPAGWAAANFSMGKN